MRSLREITTVSKEGRWSRERRRNPPSPQRNERGEGRRFLLIYRHTKPDGGDGRLGDLLVLLLELLARLAAARLLVAGELEVRTSLLGGLRL